MAAKFEEHLEALERGVRELESGEADLERTLEIYEAAVGRLKACHEILAGAEKRVKVLSEDAEGNLVEEDFAEPEE